MSIPFTTDRRLQMWSYQVSHSVLLLRGSPGLAAPTRLDLMFRAVRCIKIRQRYDSLEIDVADEKFALVEFGLTDSEIANRFVFTLRSPGRSLDYVVAGSLFVAEDDLDDFQPSSIDHREQGGHIVAEFEYR